MDTRRWEEILTSFDEVVELSADERASRLATLATTDPELRRALDLLFLADAEASARLAQLDARLLSDSTAAIDPLGLVGRTVSHFEVRELLGAGGMGVVYRAKDTRLDREVALKFLLPSYGLAAGAKARFVREAHSVAALDHPSLCALHEIGTSEDGRLFMAMPLYPGETLQARLARDRLINVGEALEIARQVTEGLECAHTAGIVHRDLKPGNVMLLPNGTAKILDFGLAKARDQSLSATGARLGTVSYMSPEQIRGQKVDQQADLWALGAVLYEMLTKRKPFAGEQDIAIAHAILNDEPVPPSTHRRDLSPAIDDLVLRLLEKDPASRYGSAADVLRELKRVQTAGTGFRYTLRWRARRASHALSRNSKLVISFGAALVMGATLYAAVEWRAVASETAVARTTIAVLPFSNLGAVDSGAYLANGLQNEISTLLLRVPTVKVIGRNSVMSYAGSKTPPLRQIASELGAGALVQGSVQVIGKRVRVNAQLMDPVTDRSLWEQTYDRTLDDVFAIQSDIARQIVATVGAAVSGRDRSALLKVPTEKAQAYLFYMQAKEYERRPDRRKDDVEAAIRLHEQAVALDPNFALARAALSIDHANMYWLRYDMTPQRLESMRAEAETALLLDPDLPQVHEAMHVVHNVGPDTDVREGLKDALIAVRGAPNDSRMWRWVAASYRRLGAWEQYDKAFAKAVELDPRDLDLLTDYGAFTHARMGRFADAIRWYDRAETLLPAKDTMGFRMAKAWTYLWWKGELDSVRALVNDATEPVMRRNRQIYPLFALRYFERKPDRALEILRESPTRVFQGTLFFEPVSLWEASLHEMRGDRAAASAAYESALVTIDSAIMKWPLDWPIHRARGAALAGLGRRDEALAEVRAMRENFIYRKDAFLRPYIGTGIAGIFAALGDGNSAVDELEKVMSQPRNGLTVHRLRLDPAWDPIRNHPRFRALLVKYAT